MSLVYNDRFHPWFQMSWMWSNGPSVDGRHHHVLTNGLGNQLFSIAAAYRLQERLLNAGYRVTVSFQEDNVQGSYTTTLLSWLPRAEEAAPNSVLFKEDPFQVWGAETPFFHGNASWSGCFQHRYWALTSGTVIAQVQHGHSRS